MEDFLEELQTLLNKYSIDNLCNTPDFILAKYLYDTILSYKDTMTRNIVWQDWGID